MRRTTLGPLTSSDLLNASLDTSIVSVKDRRESLSTSFISKMATAKGGPASAKKPAQSRQSLAPGAAPVDNRRMSVAAPVLPAKKKDVDPRPVNTRKWQEAETEALLSFLEACGYNQHLTKQAIAAGLNTKDFSQVFNFLLRGFDTSFVINGKVESEVTDVIKALHYPFPPSKTALSAIGASHSWPAFMGLLSWLRELLAYDRAVQLGDQQADAAGAAVPGTSPHFWAYLATSYTSYLAGADEEVASLEAAIEAAFDGVSAEAEAEEARLHNVMRGLLGNLQQLQGGKTVLPSVRARASDTAEDVSRLSRSMGEVEAYREELGRKVEAKVRAVEEGEAECARLRAELERLAGAVSAQELSQEDVRRLRAQSSALRDRAEVLAARVSTASAELAGLTGGLRASLGGLDGCLREYHEAARGLQMVPRGAKYSMGADFGLRLEERALSACSEEGYGRSGGDVRGVSNALLGAVMKEGIKEKIRYLKGLLVKKATESRSAILLASDAVTELTSTRTALAKAVDEAAASTAAAEDSARAEEDAVESALREGQAELARGEASKADKRAAAASAASARAEMSPAVLAELASAIEHMAAGQAGERARLADAVSRLVMRVEQHRRSVAGSLHSAAMNALSFKDGVKMSEAERAARLATPLSLTATPAAASASIAAGASMLMASSASLNSMASTRAPRTPRGGVEVGLSSPAASVLARRRTGTGGEGLSMRQL